MAVESVEVTGLTTKDGPRIRSALTVVAEDMTTLHLRVDELEETAALLRKTVLTISHQAGDDGRLFGSVTSQEIVDAIRQARGVRLDKRRVQLEDAIRTTGTHMVTVEVADGVTTEIKTIVTPQA